jgi:hypothetical protein
MDTDSLSRKVSNKIIANNPPYDDMTFPEDIYEYLAMLLIIYNT